MLAWAGNAVPAVVELRVRFPTGDVADDMATFQVDYIDALAAAAGNAKGDSLVNDLIGGSLVVVSWTRFEVSITRFLPQPLSGASLSCRMSTVALQLAFDPFAGGSKGAAVDRFDALRGAHADAGGGAIAA
jgi:hypothetical protein